MPSASVPAVGSFLPQPATGFAMVMSGREEQGEGERGKPSEIILHLSEISRASKETRFGYK